MDKVDGLGVGKQIYICYLTLEEEPGGNSGAGGEVYYSNAKNIFAYNGDMITNEDYTTIYYDYGEDGTGTSTALKVYKRDDINGKKVKFIPAKIFAQSGVIRATYRSNQGATDLSKVQIEPKPEIATSYYELKNVKATNEMKTEVTGYTNPETPELYNQGIGSRSRIFGSFKWNF